MQYTCVYIYICMQYYACAYICMYMPFWKVTPSNMRMSIISSADEFDQNHLKCKHLTLASDEELSQSLVYR